MRGAVFAWSQPQNRLFHDDVCFRPVKAASPNEAYC